MRVPLFDFEANIIQISRLADADLAEGCSIRYSRAQTLVPQKRTASSSMWFFFFRRFFIQLTLVRVF